MIPLIDFSFSPTIDRCNEILCQMWGQEKQLMLNETKEPILKWDKTVDLVGRSK